ncbi:hypothetical protein TcWFU_006891 [Taenia crassiceps]|uniref:Uncharacterized protein n=1 Tax=Taenia crassiceps TaxID=6207 RepID=A0ABR4Q4Y3_9CEST
MTTTAALPLVPEVQHLASFLLPITTSRADELHPVALRLRLHLVTRSILDQDGADKHCRLVASSMGVPEEEPKPRAPLAAFIAFSSQLPLCSNQAAASECHQSDKVADIQTQRSVTIRFAHL